MKQLLLFISIGIALFTVSCEPVELNELRDFELSIEQESDTILHLSWEKVNINTFKKYVIVRSKEAITADARPSNGYVLAEISDFNQNSYTDIVTKLSADYHYRVYVELDNRYLVSNEKHIHFDDTYPLFISYFLDEPQVRFTWSPTEVTSFKSFTLAFSDAPIPNSINNLDDLEHVIINGSTLNTTTYITNDIFNVHYKFFLDLGDRVISTNSRSTAPPDIITIPQIFQTIKHNPYNNRLYFRKNTVSPLYVFDYDQETTLPSITVPSDIQFAVNRNGQFDEIQVVDNSTKEVSIYHAGNATVTHNFPLQSSFTVDDLKVIDDWVFIVTQDQFRLFSVYDRVSENLIYNISLSTLQFGRKLEIIDKEQRTLLELSTSEAHTYTLDTAANLTQHKTVNYNSSSLVSRIAVSPDKQYFAGLASGLVYTSSLNSSFQLPGNLIYRSFVFSENSEKLYAASGNKVYIYDVATQTLDSKINKDYPIRYIFIDNGQLIIVGQNSSIDPLYTIIEKIGL